MDIKRRTALQGLVAGLIGSAVLPSWALAQAVGTGTLKVATVSEVTTLDPATGRSSEDHVILYTLYDRLVDYDFNTLEAVPYLATSWNFPDAKTLVFELRRDVKFHDGSWLNADAVKFSLDRAKSHPRSTITADVSSIDSVEVTGPFQVTLHLNQADASLLLILSDRAGMIVCPTAAQKSGDDFDRHPVGSGPMVFVAWRPNELVSMQRNQNYWNKDRPRLDGINFTPVPERQTALRSVVAGENDLVFALAPQQLQIIRRSSDLTSVVSPRLLCQLVYFNSSRPPLNDPRVRQAFNLAIDRDAFGKVAALGQYEVADMVLPKAHWAYAGELAGLYKADPEKAKTLLAEAGHADGIEINMYAADDQNSQQQAEIIIAQLSKANIKIKLSTASNTQLSAIFWQQTKGDALLLSFGGRPDPTLTYSLMFSKNGFFNAGKTEIPGLEDAINATRTNFDPAARKKAFADLQKIVMEQALVAPLIFTPLIVAFRNKVDGYRPALLGRTRLDDVTFKA